MLSLFFDQVDAGIADKEIYQVMVELNPQIKEKLNILKAFPAKSPNYGYFNQKHPHKMRKIINRILELNAQLRTQQILNNLRMSSLMECSIEELAPVDQLTKEHQTLEKGL